MAAKRLTLEERFMKFAKPDPSTGCWLWTGSLYRKGYGGIRSWSSDEGCWKTVPAHRASWELFRGPIPPGLCVLHTCDTPSCVFVGHLFIGTIQDNNSDKAMKGRGRVSKLGLPRDVHFIARLKTKPFQAQLSFRGAFHHVGQFATADEAHLAAEAYRQKLYNQEPRP